MSQARSSRRGWSRYSSALRSPSPLGSSSSSLGWSRTWAPRSLYMRASCMDEGTRAALARLGLGRARGVSIVVVAVLAGLYAYRLTFVQPRTDDAAVRANVVGIAPQVSGPIVDLRVVDNQHVSQGELLFAIDCRPYEARLARARADLALAVKEV